MNPRWPMACAALVPGILATSNAPAADAPVPAMVSHVNVVSDKVPDLSSLEAWKESYLTHQMTDADKALAIWKSVVTFTFDCTQAQELIEDENGVRDPIKAFNVYGYGLCSDQAAYVESLGRYLGFPARGWALKGHSVPELFYDNAWHLVDGSYINYWPKADGQWAGVEEIAAGLKTFFEQNPELAGNDKKLKEFARNEGWKKGPDVMSRCPTLTADGVVPEGYKGWWNFAQYYSNPSIFVYEYGSALGYELNIQLRPGERLVRNWSHRNLFVNMDGIGGKPNFTPVGKDTLAYSPAYGDLAPGRIGNGTLEYRVPLSQIQSTALTFENLAEGAALQVRDPAQPGVFVLRMPSSYIYLTGAMQIAATIPAGGDITVELSDNNGLDWKPVTPAITAFGEQKLDLSSFVYRRYDYRLRFTLKGQGTRLDALMLTHDIQHSQRALPALDQGANQITLSAGSQEGTITYQGSMDPSNKGKQVVLEDLHPRLDGVALKNLRPSGGNGEAIFDIATPGEMTRLRFGTHWRARGDKDVYDVQVSFDEGKTFNPIRKLEGPTAARSAYFVYSDIPSGTKSAQVKFTARQANTLMMFAMRISADYKEPNSGFRPVKITYDWEENGQSRQDTHIAHQPQETYTINCATKPALKSITLQLAE